MSDTALIKRPVGDDLALKVKYYKDEQVANRENEEAPFKRRVLIESFLRLSYRYFGLPREFVKNLSKEERAELLKKVFEEAKLRLRWQSPLLHSVTLTIVGALFVFGIYNNRKVNFPAFKLRRLYKWYMENYGADDLEMAMKSGDFDKKISAKTMSLALAGSLIKKPEPHEVVLPALAEGVLKANESASKSIGFNPAALLEIQLFKFFKDKGIRIFKIDDVDKYLRRQVKKKSSWRWHPLREKDKTPGSNNNERYSKLISPRSSVIVEEIERQFGDKVSFWVTHYVDRPSHHFIGVWTRGMDIIIFGLWHDDEFKPRLAG